MKITTSKPWIMPLPPTPPCLKQNSKILIAGVGLLPPSVLSRTQFLLSVTIAVYSPTNITSSFYPVSKFSYFCICDTPLNCYNFTHQSHPFAHLTSFRRLQNSLSKTRLLRNSYFSYRRCCAFAQLCIADRLSTIKLSKK